MPSLCTVIQTSDRRKAHPCGLPCVEGHDTCQFHIPGVMVPCPIDPNHTVRADRVAAHVKKCPSKDKSAIGHAYFTLDINKGSDSEVFVPEKGIDEGISPSLMAQLPSLMENTSPDGWMDASTVTEAADGTSNDYAPVFAVRKKQKHDVQLSAMLQQIEGAGLLDPSFTYLEVGCGRGALSVAIQMRLPEATCILVDTRVAGYQRGTVALAKKHGCVGALHRLQIDLKDFNIAGALEELSLASDEKGGRLVIIGKHVCGAGTDFALRMLEQSLPSNWSFAGVAIAQCCHSRLSVQDYVGNKYLPLLLDLPDQEQQKQKQPPRLSLACWKQLQKMSSWCLAGSTLGHHRESSAAVATVSDPKAVTAATAPRTPQQDHDPILTPSYLQLCAALTPAEKYARGIAAQKLWDEGRRRFCLQHLTQAQCIYYTSPEVTPENVLLLASVGRSAD